MYKTIVVHVDSTARCSQRIAVGVELAKRWQGHLVGAAMTGLQTYLLPQADYQTGLQFAGLSIESLRAEASDALVRFEAAATQAGLTSFEGRCIDDEAGIGMSLQARYSDLVIVSRMALDEFLPGLRPDFPDYVALNASSPVLVMPLAAPGASIGERVTVAWNGSPQAMRAIASAIPILQSARQVDLVVFDSKLDPVQSEANLGHDMAQHLARHGISCTVSQRTAEPDDGRSLLAFADEKQSDLIVMGAYGHSRFRELLLGGMTRSVLSTSPVPLWMAH